MSNASTREGKRLIVTPVEAALHRKLKIAAAASDHTLEEICRAAFERYLASVHFALRRAEGAQEAR
jgi:hypothetical protein